jgi:phytoene desaturase
MYQIIEGMQKVALHLGVTFKTDEEIRSIETDGKKATGVINAKGAFTKADIIISSADYHHTEQQLLPPRLRNYKENYWDTKTFAPSCLIFYLGVNKKISRLLHHNLFFDKDFEKHATEIYDTPKWPEQPLFYVCCPSKTDDSVSPPGMENLFILIPIATGLKDTELIRDFYFTKVMERIEKECRDKITAHIVYKKSYCINDFVKDYNAYKGNAYGLANTLRQTAVLKPSVRNRHLQNLFYTGQLTVPGPGVPPALISGKISAQQALNYLRRTGYETVIR